MSKSHVLDASAVLDFVEGGPGGKRVEQLFKDALGKRFGQQRGHHPANSLGRLTERAGQNKVVRQRC